MLSIVNFFMGFHIDNSYGKVRSDEIIKSNIVHSYTTDMKFKVFYVFLSFCY